MMSDPKRADPFEDLSDFQPTPAKKPAALVQKEAIRQLSEANNFPSRAPERLKSAKPVVQRRRRGAEFRHGAAPSRPPPRCRTASDR